jgi:hypothetical protein
VVRDRNRRDRGHNTQREEAAGAQEGNCLRFMQSCAVGRQGGMERGSEAWTWGLLWLGFRMSSKAYVWKALSPAGGAIER